MINGNFDRFDKERIDGWAMISEAPTVRLRFDVLRGDEVIGEFFADQFREDLAEAEIGDATCAFSFEVPTYLSLGDLRKLRFRLGGSDFYWQPKRIPV